MTILRFGKVRYPGRCFFFTSSRALATSSKNIMLLLRQLKQRTIGDFMKFLSTFALLIFSLSSFSSETVCGNKAVVAASALIKANVQEATVLPAPVSLTRKNYNFAAEGGQEVWEVSLKYRVGRGQTFTYTVVRSTIAIEFGEDGEVTCNVVKVELPYAN